MTTEERRIAALTELGRVLRPGGKAMVTSWAMNQNDQHGAASNYVQQGSDDPGAFTNAPNSQQLPIHKSRTEFVAQGS